MVNAPDALRQECVTAIQQMLSGVTAEQHPFEFQQHAGRSTNDLAVSLSYTMNGNDELCL